jgi:hypothetical protein
MALIQSPSDRVCPNVPVGIVVVVSICQRNSQSRRRWLELKARGILGDALASDNDCFSSNSLLVLRLLLPPSKYAAKRSFILYGQCVSGSGYYSRH